MSNSLLHALYQHAQNHPQKICIIELNETWTYQKYWNTIYNFSQFLIQSDIQKGECVMVVATQSAAFLAAQLAIHLAGGIFVPLEKNVGNDRIQDILEQTKARLIIAPTNPGLSELYIPLADVVNQPDYPLTELVFPDGHELSEILFTTGTTGKSKGVQISFAADVAIAENVISGTKMKPDNCELIPVPINHSYGIRRYYANLYNGSTICILDGVVFVKRFFDMLDTYPVTSLALVPSSLALLYRLSGDKIAQYADQLRYIQVSTATLPESDKQRTCQLLPNTHLVNFYGSTESGCACSVNVNAADIPASCVGYPGPNSEFIFVDSNGVSVAGTKEEPGLLANRGKINMVGYHNEPELTAQTVKNGYVHTKDMAYKDSEGRIHLLGRMDDIINIGGNKIAPDEIEDVLKQMDGIADCACVPIPDAMAGQVPKMFVVMNEGSEFSPIAIRKYMENHLEAFKIPKVIVEIPEIPRTYNGKVRRIELRELQ